MSPATPAMRKRGFDMTERRLWFAWTTTELVAHGRKKCRAVIDLQRIDTESKLTSWCSPHRMAAAVQHEEATRPMSVEEELKNFRATWDAPDPTRPPDVEIVMPEADLEDWPRLDRAHCAAARDAERISGRTLIDEEEDLEDPSCVPNPYEFEDAAEAELREVFPLRTILCGARAIAVRPPARWKRSGMLWAGQVGLATWCGLPEGRAALAGARVVELEATLGLAGAAAYDDRLGDCEDCCLTTWREADFENLSRPDANNGCRVERLNWFDLEVAGALGPEAAAALGRVGPMDVALAADVLDDDNGRRFARVLDRLAAANPGLAAVVVQKRPPPPGRKLAEFLEDNDQWGAFLEEARRLGFAVDVVDCADLQQPLANNLEMLDVDFGAYDRATLRRSPTSAATTDAPAPGGGS